jgi:hypothetical protein
MVLREALREREVAAEASLAGWVPAEEEAKSWMSAAEAF